MKTGPYWVILDNSNEGITGYGSSRTPHLYKVKGQAENLAKRYGYKVVEVYLTLVADKPSG